MMQFNVNTKGCKHFTDTLRNLHRAALPNAVRGTLNKAVFDVKTNTMPQTAKAYFVHRQANFFKANSRFEQAKGFDIKNMQATVGMVTSRLKDQSHNYSVRDLEEQEYGGVIQKRAFVPTAASRRGKAASNTVMPNARLRAINNLIEVKNATGKNSGQKFIKSAIHAGKGGFVVSARGLFKVNSLPKRGTFKKKAVLKITQLYSFKENRAVKVAPTGFMRRASLQSGKKMEKYFEFEAERQFKKYK